MVIRKAFRQSNYCWLHTKYYVYGHPWYCESASVHHVRRLIENQQTIRLTVKDDEGWFGTRFPEGVDELYFCVLGIIKDIERLKSLFDLFAEVLDHLCRIGSAYEDERQLRKPPALRMASL